MKKFLTTIMAAAMLFAASTAMALPYIDGSITFSGLDHYLTGNSALTATGVGFTGLQSAQGLDGVYDGVESTHGVSFMNIDFGHLATIAPSTHMLSITNLWSFSFYNGVSTDSYSFDLASLTHHVDTTIPGSNRLMFDGKGTLHATGYADTPGLFTLTATDGASTKLALSAGNTAAPVPEPGTMMLLGVGMLGLAIYGKRRMNSNS